MTPENLESRGYTYVADVYVTMDAPESITQEIFRKLDSGDYLLGNTASFMLETEYFWYGLYEKSN